MSTAYQVSASIAAPSSPPSSAPRRIACDRCHGQKLKCPRDVDGGGPCKRCAKAGAICQVSPARATGRPAKNPKLQHRKSESSTSINSSRPSLTESAGSADDEILTPGTKTVPIANHGPTSSPEDYFPTPAMPCLPMSNDTSKFYTTPDIQFDFVDIADNNYSNALGFDFDDGTNFMNFGSSLPTMMPSTFPRNSSIAMGYACMTPQFGVMPPPPTPSIPLIEDVHDNGSTSGDSKYDEQSSRSGSLLQDFHSYDLTETFSKVVNPRSSFSPSLKRGYTVSEESLFTTSLPIRTISSEESMSKKRRFSSLATSTPDHELTWTSNLSHSQALSTVQFEVDNFSKSVMSQNVGSNEPHVESDVTVDVGVLLPISDKFMVLIPQICHQATTTIRSAPKARPSSSKQFLKPRLERSQTEPDSIPVENAVAESKSIDSGLVQLIFTCQTRLHFAFSIALDVISHNVATSNYTSSSPNHPSSSIGSYTLPTSSPLSTLLHLHAISHSLERLDATLKKHLATGSTPSSGFFEGIFCKQKRNEMAIHTFKERAFEEASERKNQLMSRIRDIVAEVAGNEI